MSEATKRVYLLAEYCPGPFYMGWWLYERDRNDGSENDDRWDRWGWLRDADPWLGGGQWSAHKLCVEMRHQPPEPRRYSDIFAGWFARTFPGGLLVEADERSYRLVGIVSAIPKQVRRGVIRTIRGAEQSFRAACRRDKNPQRPGTGSVAVPNTASSAAASRLA